MDKYEYNLKLEEIDKLVDQGDYEEAANLADTIEWKRVRNTRTLCLISEIYEAAGRMEESKNLLVRAYRRSPVGRTVLYRLVEVTTALGQYDEAIEYYSEYVQAAPHDNNRYILKYKIYRGRGSSLDELITILEEYLGQEYTERWAYELATLYQQAGHMQKCFAACDDLVLWFHTGKYVQKALELKKKYTTLTPRQQQIYENCLQEKENSHVDEEAEEDNVIQKVDSADGEVIAANIIAQTEKGIGEEVAARKAEMDREAAQNLSAAAEERITDDLSQTQKIAAEVRRIQQEAARKAELENQKQEEPKEEQKEVVSPAAEPAQAENAGEDSEEEVKDIQVELAKTMREIIAGVVKRTEEFESDIPASVDSGKNGFAQRVEVPEVKEPAAGQLSIDDVLLSMGDKGKKPAEEPEQEETKKAAEVPMEKEPEVHMTVTKAATEDLTEQQREALQYTNNPEKLLKKRSALPTYAEEPAEEPEDLGKTRRIPSREELMEAAKQDVLSEKTIRIPTEEVRRRLNAGPVLEDEADQMEMPKEEDAMLEENYPEVEEEYLEEVLQEAFDEDLEEADEDLPEEEFPEENEEDFFTDEEAAFEEYAEEEYEDSEEAYDEYEGDEYEEDYDEEYLTIPSHLRELFSGFTEIEGLEDQIANAIIQAESKGDDRTSRTGNILIFGAHGSGKTTLAMNLAKAIAQDKGNPVMKMAKIYAADLNRKDIAATIAKIAGGTLIIEEAGDLEPNTIEQLTTAMEFRTDGLVVILEDEQQYIHELLMRHPRFTMKFTAQIYIPVYTAEELAMFGQIYANAQDYVISEEALDVLYDKISSMSASGTAVAISDVIDMVAKAIQNSNKFFRKLSMGKKRYDENDYILLFSKDFR